MPKNKDPVGNGALVLFDELKVCTRRGAIFYAGGKSQDFERCGAMTEEYARELHRRLGSLIAELDEERGATPVMDGIDLALDGPETLAFTLHYQGNPVASGKVTVDVGRKAKAFLDEKLPPPKVVTLPVGKRL